MNFEEVLKNEKIPEVIQRILPLYHHLEMGYLEHMEYFLDEDCISLGTHLSGLATSIMEDMKYERKLSFNDFRHIFSIVEEYLSEAKLFQDELTLNFYEVMFFEDILNILSNVDNEQNKKKHAKLLHSVIGPIGLELCKQNDEYWGKYLLPYSTK